MSTLTWKLRVFRNWNYVYTDMETACTPKLKLCVHWHGNCVYSEIETMCTLTWTAAPDFPFSLSDKPFYFPKNWSHKIRPLLILHEYRSQLNSPLTSRVYQKYQVLKRFADEPHEEKCPILCSFHTISAKSHLNQSSGRRDDTYSPVPTSNHRPAIPTDRCLCFPQFVWANVWTIPTK